MIRFLSLVLIATVSFCTPVLAGEEDDVSFDNGMPTEIRNMHEQMLHPMVRVSFMCGKDSEKECFAATGTIVKREPTHSFVVTNHHVIKQHFLEGTYDKKKDITFMLPTTVHVGDTAVKGQIVSWSVKRDLALLRIEHTKTAPVTMLAGPVFAFEQVFAVGAGAGLQIFPTAGIVSNPKATKVGNGDEEVIQISAPITYGNSGGAAFVRRDEHWVLCGIVNKAYGTEASIPFRPPLTLPTPHIAFVIPAHEVKAFLKASGVTID